MSRSYNLDPKSAAQAGVANYISGTGKYKGKFTRAEIVTSQQDTDGVEFSFVSDEGLRSDYLTLWTYNSKGESLPSLKVLNAIMVCLRLKVIEPATIAVQDNTGTRSTQGFPALMNKPIGVLLQREEYEKTKRDDNGNAIIGFKFNLVAPFDAASEMTAGEVLSKATSAEQLAKMVGTLKDRPLQKRTARQATPAHSSTSFPDDDDDSIPY